MWDRSFSIPWFLSDAILCLPRGHGRGVGRMARRTGAPHVRGGREQLYANNISFLTVAGLICMWSEFHSLWPLVLEIRAIWILGLIAHIRGREPIQLLWCQNFFFFLIKNSSWEILWGEHSRWCEEWWWWGVFFVPWGLRAMPALLRFVVQFIFLKWPHRKVITAAKRH